MIPIEADIMRTTASRKSILMNTARFFLAAIMLAWLIARIPAEDLRQTLSQAFHQPHWWTAGIALTGLGLMAGAFRWLAILHVQHLDASPADVVRFFFIGQFFNAFSLGSCGGDLARVYYIVRRHPRRRTASASTVLVDRAMGLAIFVLVGWLMMSLHGGIYIGPKMRRVVAWLGMTMLAGGLFLMLLPIHTPLKKLSLMPRGLRVHLATRLLEALHFYRTHPALMVVAALLSTLNLFCLTAAAWCFGHSLLINRTFADYLTVFPIITVLSALPLTPGALGLRETLFAAVFFGMGVPPARSVPLSLLVYAGGLVWSLMGGILFLSAPRGASPSFTLDELRSFASGAIESEPAPETERR